MLHLIALVSHQCRKNRSLIRDRQLVESTIQRCTESITHLLHVHGGPRVVRQMQNAMRYREFVCSMLYLMRVGITYQSRQILPKIEALNLLLPLQVLLPTMFKIRAKSITEGEVPLVSLPCLCNCEFFFCYYFIKTEAIHAEFNENGYQEFANVISTTTTTAATSSINEHFQICACAWQWQSEAWKPPLLPAWN